jgi:hydrogenase maturation protein HypF
LVEDPIAEAVARLRAGEIVGVKGLGGFHLAVDATNTAAVGRLRERKRRIEKPFAVMVSNLETVSRFCMLGAEERQLLCLPQRPIVLLPRMNPSLLADNVAPFNSYLGIFLAYTPIHHLLFKGSELQALVMTSGNISEEPISPSGTPRRSQDSVTLPIGFYCIIAKFFVGVTIQCSGAPAAARARYAAPAVLCLCHSS